MTEIVPGHWTCQHRLYRLNCAEYDELYEHAQGRCEICGIKEAFAPQRKLFIDHDHALGDADSVRGLLCGRCNTGIDRKFKPMTGPDIDAYLSGPWHARPRANLHLVDAAEDMSATDRLDLLGAQFMRIREQSRLKTRYAREFVRWHLKPAIRAARRAGTKAREISVKTGYNVEYVRLIWGPVPGDPDWIDPMRQQAA